MILSAEIVREHIEDESWIKTNAKLILRSIKEYPKTLVDELYIYEEFETYIIKYNLYSEKMKRWTLINAVELSISSFTNICALFSGNDLDILYKTVQKITVAPKKYAYYCILWDKQLHYFIQDETKKKELFNFSFENAGQRKITEVIKFTFFTYPELLHSWMQLDPIKVVRFYADLGKISYFTDDSIDILINLLNTDSANQIKLQQMLKYIVHKRNCSTVKHAELLFTL